MSMAVGFSYKHQQYMHDSAISTHAPFWFQRHDLLWGWHSAHKITCSQPL